MISFDNSSRFQPFLFAGERILWTGRPKQGMRFSPLDIFAIPFSLLWTGFFVFAFAGTLTEPDAGLAYFMPVPFLLFGLYFTIGRFFHDSTLRKKISYAVTSERVLILSGLWSSRLTSLDIHRLPRLELTERRDRTGTISFDSSSGISSFGRTNGFALWVPALAAGSEFYRIDNPRKVYELIRNQSRA